MTYFSIPDDEKLYIDKSRHDRVVITGNEVRLDPDTSAGDRHLVVRATNVKIYGRLSFPGKNVEIFAQSIEAFEGSCIDVSGADGIPSYTNSKAPPGQNHGYPGQAGRNGGDGYNAGNIRIIAEKLSGILILKANGGNGGDAESGGNGANGKNGSNYSGATPPENGGNGGAAGRAGKPGKGGDGGKIEVFVVHMKQDQIVAEAREGHAGKPGSHGSPGKGGLGGKGGHYLCGYTYSLCPPV